MAKRALRPATLAPDGLPGDEMRKTNPISGGARWDEAPPAWGEGNCAKQSQTWASWGIRRTSHGGGCCAKRSQFPEAGHRGGVSIADCGLGIADWEQTCDETPLRQRHAGRGASCQTNPIGRNESYETKPIGPPGRCRVGRPTHSLSLRAGSTKNRGPIVQNKPNCPKRGTEAVSAGVAVKSPHYCSFPLFQHSNPQCWAGRGLEDGRHGVPPPPLAPPTLPRENSSEN
jgi:hypothetical protein